MQKIVVALLSVTALVAACATGPDGASSVHASAIESVAAKQSPQEQTNPTPEVVAWDGRWSGVIPCASCPGIVVDLTFNNDGTFRLREEYQGSKGSFFVTEGTTVWDEAARVLTLRSDDREQKLFFGGEGTAVYLDAQDSPAPLYQLVKQAEYLATGQQLILPLQTVRVEDNKVLFNGLLNFSKVQEGGFQSVRGNAVIDCDKQHVSFKDAAYYSDVDAMGERIASITNLVQGGFRLGSNSANSVLLQVAETFCPSM